MFLPGQKVVCVNDVFPDAIKKFYWKLPVRGVTYTIRDLVPGIDPVGEAGEMCVYLVELINPCSDMPPYPERGFKAERFVRSKRTPKRSRRRTTYRMKCRSKW